MPAKRCGCHLDPVDDEREESDLCSEATGAFNGIGWVIVYCATHNTLGPEEHWTEGPCATRLGQ